MDEEIIMLGDIKVEKHKFHQHKNSILIYDLNIDRIVNFYLTFISVTIKAFIMFIMFIFIIFQGC